MFKVIPSYSQGLLLALCMGISPGNAAGQYAASEIELCILQVKLLIPVLILFPLYGI